MPTKVLVIDDDTRLQKLLARFLVEHDMKVYTASDAQEMQKQIQRNVFDMYILDINLPNKNGLEICKSIRELGDTTPVIMLTARGEDVDRITGLEIGADDYLSKPFNPQELLARMRSVFRRAGIDQGLDAKSFMFTFNDYVFDGLKQEIRFQGQAIPLSQNQYKLLKILVLHKGEAVSRTQLTHRVYGREHSPDSRDIDMLVSSLRKQLCVDGQQLELIKTIRGIGYMLLV